MILDALRRSNGNRKIAVKTGIGGRTLGYKLAKYKEQGVPVPGLSVTRGLLR